MLRQAQERGLLRMRAVGYRRNRLFGVMPALVAGIHVFLLAAQQVRHG
jgi:hypothetical protein